MDSSTSSSELAFLFVASRDFSSDPFVSWLPLLEGLRTLAHLPRCHPLQPAVGCDAVEVPS